MAINSNDNIGKRDFSYVGKDFTTLKENLINYTKTYFPDTYSDFNEASPGMVIIEQAAAIGDMLSFYQDVQLKESLLLHATEKKNVLSLAQSMGYKPKVTSPAVVNLTVYQLVPSVYLSEGGGANYGPDSRYYLTIKEGMLVESSTNSNITFRTIDNVDFSVEENREVEVYERDINGIPLRYLITKTIKAISATEVTETFIFQNDTDYPSITLSNTNIIQVVSVVDSDNNKWYEVPYLAQETIFIDTPNLEENGNMYQYSQTVPYILELKKVPKRFSVKINNDNSTELQFGSGDVRLNDEILLPNSKNIGIGTANSISRLNDSIDPSNFLKTNTFGAAPINTTISVTYLIGGGVESNVNTGDLVNIRRIEFNDDLLSIPDTLVESINDVKASVAVENLGPATGGRGAESVEEIRQNALAMFGSQNRAVTKEDYIVRALSMPARYGSVTKVYVSPDSEIDINSPSSILSNPKNIQEFTELVVSLKDLSKEETQKQLVKYLSNKKSDTTQKNNPFAINMYVLGYDSNKNLTNLNKAIKENLKTYLSEYRLLTDGVNILDGFIVNIGLDFEIITYPNYNKREVLANCLVEMQNYFNIDNWTFNKKINISEIELILANIEGVMSVPTVKVYNLCAGNGTYSPNKYNIEQATQGKIIYPSLDPCIFEVKYPNKDIKGRAL
jgi:hypothetical protein